MNLLPYNEKYFYMSEFDASMYQVFMTVENWKPGLAIVIPEDVNTLCYLHRLIQDGFIFMDCEPECIIPGKVYLTDKGRSRLNYLKERLGLTKN